MIAARVGSSVITTGDVERRMNALRAGPRAAVLPGAETAEGRQFRRWVAQILVIEQILRIAAEDAGLPADRTAAAYTPVDQLELGTAVAAALHGSPVGAQVYRNVTAGAAVPEADVARYYRDNRDLYAAPPAREVIHWHDGRPVNRGRPYLLQQGELGAKLDGCVFSAAAGERVGPIDGHVFQVGPLHRNDRSFDEVAGDIRMTLLRAGRRRVFLHWLEGRLAADVTLMPGFEHPGDTTQPDSTHRH
jgi:[acyl-carrier-protein] S-malonyltransferase